MEPQGWVDLALVIVTAAAVIATVMEGHRHEEAVEHDAAAEEQRLAHIVDEALTRHDAAAQQ